MSLENELFHSILAFYGILEEKGKQWKEKKKNKHKVDLCSLEDLDYQDHSFRRLWRFFANSKNRRTNTNCGRHNSQGNSCKPLSSRNSLLTEEAEIINNTIIMIEC